MCVTEILLPSLLFKEFFEGAPETFALLPAPLTQRGVVTFIRHAFPFELLPYWRTGILNKESMYTCNIHL